MLAAVFAAGIGLTVLPATSQADPGRSIPEVARELDRLQEQAEAASERFNDAKLREGRAQRALTQVSTKVAASQARLDSLHDDVGELVRTLYTLNSQGGTTLRLLLADSAESYLEQSAAVETITRRQANVLRTVAVARQQLRNDQIAAKQKEAELEAIRGDMRSAKEDVDSKVQDTKELLASLKEEERQRLAAERERLAREAAARADAAARAAREGGSHEAPAPDPAPDNSGDSDDSSDSGSSGSSGGSGKASGAVSYALAQVGKSYVYAATGPSSYDCSGLTMAAYASVGIYLPHQSGQQYYYGRHVSSGELQPGDLVFYYSPIHHVAMYVGGGRIVHAANPSSGVRTDPLFLMPYTGATRIA